MLANTATLAHPVGHLDVELVLVERHRAAVRVGRVVVVPERTDELGRVGGGGLQQVALPARHGTKLPRVLREGSRHAFP